ncbi:MAG: methionyl-tRNA formyltransferase [candidate division Zixibacteria bacterium]
MRLIFFGTPDFALRCLRKILSSKHEVAAVVTAPDRPRGRGRKLAQPDVKKLALEHGLEVLQPDRLKDPAFLERLDSLNASFYCVVAFRILPEEVFSRPPDGCVNLHASLLPQYRGAAPINWALINGESETGLTTFFIGKKVDTGDVLLQGKIAIGPDEIYGDLYGRMAEAGGDLLIKTMDLIESNNYSVVGQDHTKASPAPKIHPELGLIDWDKSASEIHNLARGLSPKPGAFSFLNGKRVTLIRTSRTETPANEPGMVTRADPKTGITVSCREGEIEILEIKPESGKALSGADFVKGYRLKLGDRFENRADLTNTEEI